MKSRTTRPALFHYTKSAVIAATATIMITAANNIAWAQLPVTPASCESRTPISRLPARINTCGSYYVTACLVGQSGKDGIIIDADDVTIDLNGFSLIGVSGSKNGIVVMNSHSQVSVYDGSLRGWGEDGVHLVDVAGGVVRDLSVTDSGGDGIDVGDCIVLERCVATDNTDDGIRVSRGCVARSCTARNNGKNGISTFENGMISNCSTVGNGWNGIFCERWATVVDCSALSNESSGFSIGSEGTIERCTSSLNGGAGHGIIMCGGSVARGNTIAVGVNTGQAGIYVPPQCQECRIEGNSISGNSFGGINYGIRVDGTANIILGNTSRGTAVAFQLAAGNSHGPIVMTAGGGDISLIAGADSPWANFAY